VQNWYKRTRLTAILDKLSRELLLLFIHALSGLVNGALIGMGQNESSWPVAWFSLDTAFNDPDRFAHLSQQCPANHSGQVKITMGLLTAQQTRAQNCWLNSPCNEILSTPHMVLVLLDDDHVKREAHSEAFIFCLNIFREPTPSIISTRTDPPLDPPLPVFGLASNSARMRTTICVEV